MFEFPVNGFWALLWVLRSTISIPSCTGAPLVTKVWSFCVSSSENKWLICPGLKTDAGEWLLGLTVGASIHPTYTRLHRGSVGRESVEFLRLIPGEYVADLAPPEKHRRDGCPPEMLTLPSLSGSTPNMTVGG